MKRAIWLGTWGLVASLSIGCGGRSDEARDDGQDFDIAGTMPITATGCLTASGDRFALTSLEQAGRAPGTPATELYRLVGSDEELRALVGREVRVTGPAASAQVAEIVERGAAAPVGTSGAADVQPQVTTTAETRLEVRQLRVSEVTPTGNECAAATELAP